MSRSLLTLLLLLHYLLVVCVSVSARPEQPVTRPFAYVHHHDCQLKNAWRGGVCFEDCNGVQYQLHKGHKHMPLQQVLASLKGVDLHCLPLVAVLATHAMFGVATRPLPDWETNVPAGVSERIDAPPRRG
jgi:hypothetical protein